MKLQYIIALILCSSVINDTQAEDTVKPPVKSMVIDTGWVNTDPTQRCSKTHYPACIEIMHLKGDGAKYKAVFMPRPKGNFDYKCVTGISMKEYEKLNKDLTAKGFVQIFHQVVTVMRGNVHQSVWVGRRTKEEIDADFALLRSQDQTKYNATPKIMSVADRIFTDYPFKGLKKTEIETLLGKSENKKATTWTYVYHNGEQGIMRRIHFDKQGLATKIEILLTE